MIAVVDYGFGNIAGIKAALEQVCTQEVVITSNAGQIEQAGKIVLPGAGSFPDAIDALNKAQLTRTIISCIVRGSHFLGINLGMQMLFDVSYPGGQTTGFGYLPGKVVNFDFPTALTGRSLSAKHVGWDSLQINYQCPLFKNIQNGAKVYFAHSSHVITLENSLIAAGCDYGYIFPAAVWRNNAFGVQFNPEDSGETGLAILKNFTNL